MGLLPGLHGRLRELSAAGGDDLQLPGELDSLLALAVQAVRSCLAVSVTLLAGGLPVTVTALTQAALLDPVRASLALRLPGRTATRADATGHAGVAPGSSTGSGGLLVFYAAVPGAWAQPAADLAALLDLDPRSAAVDRHLELPALATDADVLAAQLADVSAVDRALGVLLDRGLLPADGHRELRRLAATREVGLPAAARGILAALRPTTP